MQRSSPNDSGLKRFLRSWFGRSGTVHKRPPAKRPVQLGVECLEERAVPTVNFKPNFPGIAVDPKDWFGNPVVKSSAALKSPPVYILFANSASWDWSKGQGPAAEAAVLQSAQRILSGPFLSGLDQYGYDDNARLANPSGWIDFSPTLSISSTVTGKYPFNSNETALQTYLFGSPGTGGALSRVTASPPAAGPDDFHVPVYVIVTAPGATVLPGSSGGSGFNTFMPNNLGAVALVETSPMANDSFNLGLWKDGFTDVFSHEMAEVISHKLVIDFPAAEVGINNVVAQDQVADGEADGGDYTARTSNARPAGSPLAAQRDLVQAYWSDKDQAFIIPDGNSQATFENPVWSTGAKPALQKLDEVVQAQATGIDGSVTLVPATDRFRVDDLGVEFNRPTGGPLFYHAWTDDNENLFIAMSQNGGQTLGTPVQVAGDLARGNPSLAVFNNQLFIAWTGQNNSFADPEGYENVAVVSLDSTGNPTGQLTNKQVMDGNNGNPEYVSEHAPALESKDNALFLAFAGDDNTLWLDCITPSNPAWGQHLTDTGGRSDSPPALLDDKVTNRLILSWTDTNNNSQFAQVNLLGQTGSRLVSLSQPVNGVLTVDGYQYVGMNDTIALDRNSSGGLRVTLNGVVSDYAVGALSAIVINTGTGTNTVNVHVVDPNVPVTINALGHTAVNVGNNGSMIPIQGSLSVWGAYHSVDLSLDARISRGQQVIQLQNQGTVETVTGMSQGSTVQFGKTDLGSLTMKTGRSGTVIGVWDTPDTPVPTDLETFPAARQADRNYVYVYGTTGALNVNGQGGQDVVTVYPAGFGRTPTLANTILGAVDVTNAAGSTTLVVNDRNDASDHPTATLAPARLSGMAGADILWQPTARSTGGVTSLAVYGGTGANTFTVTQTAVLSGGPTQLQPGNGTGTDVVNIEHTTGTLTVGLGSGGNVVNVSPVAQTLDNIQGAVTVTGNSGYDRLWVYDTNTTANYNYVLAGSSVWRATRFRGGSIPSAAINYSALTEIHVGGGQGQEAFLVQDTAAQAATYLTTNSRPGTPVGSQVFVTGTSGGLSVTGTSGSTSVVVGAAPFMGRGFPGGSTNGTVQAIKGNILVNSAGGQVALDVNDSADASSPSAVLGPRVVRVGPVPRALPGQESLTGLAPAAISYFGDVVTPTIELGSGTLAVNATGVRPTTVNAVAANVNVLGTTGPVQVNATRNTFVMAGGGSLQQLRGAVAVNSADNSARLVVAAFNDTSGSGTLAAGASDVLTGLSPAPISYAPGQVSPTIDLGANQSLTVTGTQGVDPLGPVTIKGSGTNNVLTVDDRQGTGVPTNLPAGATLGQVSLSYTVTDKDVSRTASYGYSLPNGGGGGTSFTDISYQGITSLELDGSNSPAAFNLTATSAPTMVKGGSGNDTFKVTAAGNFTADGGGGVNGLDYSAYPGPVTVDLPLGTATGIAGGIRNFRNVTGGPGSNVLVGDGSGNVLSGGPGRDLLIAGPGPGKLTGGSGEDVLVGGATHYDTDPTALAALMAEWGRSDGVPYAARVDHLLHGGGLNGSTVLGATDFTNNGGGNTLTGGNGLDLDLFYGIKARDANDWNPGQGEVFVENPAQVGLRIDAHALSTPWLILDGATAVNTQVPAPFTLAPGTHTLADYYGWGSRLTFTVRPDGTVSYDSSLEGVLTGQGTTTLAVKGATLTIDARALSLPWLSVDAAVARQTTSAFPLTVLPGAQSLRDYYGFGTAVNFSVAANGAVSYDPALEGVVTGAGTTSLIVKGATFTVDASALSLPLLTLDAGVAKQTSAAFPLTVLPGPQSLRDYYGFGTPISFSVAAGGAVSYDPALEGVVTGAGTSTLAVKGATFTIDARALSLPWLTVDAAVAQQTTSAFPLTVLPGAQSLRDYYGFGSNVNFTVAANGAVSYDPSLEGVVTGQGTSTLAVKGATVTLDARALSLPWLTVDAAIAKQTGAAFPLTVLPGPQSLRDYYGFGTPISFSVAAGGAVSYDPALEGVVTGAGTTSLIVKGATFTVDASALSTPWLTLDAGLAKQTSAAFPLTVLPGPQSLRDYYGFGTPISFSVAAGGAVSYDPALEGVVTGAGTSALTVKGATVTIDARALSLPWLTVDAAVARQTTSTFALTVLPGAQSLRDYYGSGSAIAFTVSASGAVGYDASLEGVVTGAGTSTLTVNGVGVQIDATALSGTTAFFTFAGTTYATSAVQTLRVLPGQETVTAGSQQVVFSLSTQDQVDYAAQYEAVVQGRGGNSLVFRRTT